MCYPPDNSPFTAREIGEGVALFLICIVFAASLIVAAAIWRG